eukprot:6490254-Amphidinium_carterae.2
MVGPGFVASPTRQVGGNQPSCRELRMKWAEAVLGSQRNHRPFLKSAKTSLPVLAKVEEVGVGSGLQPWMCRTNGVDSSQAGWYHQVSGASPVITDDAFRKLHRSAPSGSAGVTLRACPFALVAQIRGQIELHASFPLLLRNRVPPFHSTIINGGIKGVVLVRAVVRPKSAPLRKDGPSLSCPSLDKSGTQLLSQERALGCMVSGTSRAPLPSMPGTGAPGVDTAGADCTMV